MFSLREPEGAEFPALAALEESVFSVPWSEQALRSFAEGEQTYLVCAFLEDGTVCGYGALYYVLDEGTVANLAVRADVRGQGIGRALFSELMDRAHDEHLSFVTLEVRESNAIARALYESFGFLPCGTRRHFYTRPTEDGILYRRELGVTD